MNRRASYGIVRETPDYVLIRDLGPWDQYLTVTNDAEAVVENLSVNLNGRKLFCIDSEGETDELLVVDGKFAGFKPYSGTV